MSMNMDRFTDFPNIPTLKEKRFNIDDEIDDGLAIPTLAELTKELTKIASNERLFGQIPIGEACTVVLVCGRDYWELAAYIDDDDIGTVSDGSNVTLSDRGNNYSAEDSLFLHDNNTELQRIASAMIGSIRDELASDAVFGRKLFASL